MSKPDSRDLRAKPDGMIVNGREYRVTVTTPAEPDPEDQARREREVIAVVVGSLRRKLAVK